MFYYTKIMTLTAYTEIITLHTEKCSANVSVESPFPAVLLDQLYDFRHENFFVVFKMQESAYW